MQISYAKIRITSLVLLVVCALVWYAALSERVASMHGQRPYATPTANTEGTALAVAPTVASTEVPPTPIPPSPSAVDHMQITSTILGGVRDIDVYLPPGYLSPDQTNRRYPVLYLLHGAPGSYSDWVQNTNLQATADRLIAAGILPPIVIVMPDGNYGEEGDSHWVNGNSDAGFGPMEDYVSDELLPGIDGRYRTLPDRAHRAIGGLSAGAYGALNLLVHHPNLWSVALLHSGFYRAQPTDDGTDLFASDESAQHANSPIEHLGDSPLLRSASIYVDVGTDDPWFVPTSEELDRALTAHHIDHVFHVFPGGHSWDFWAAHLPDSLAFLGARLHAVDSGNR